MLKAGDKAPDFALGDAQGRTVRLSDFAGRRVVLYFYPRDNTPGCTRQACAFRGAFEGFRKADAVVVGISRDGESSHKRFAGRYDLPFVLLSDPQREAMEAYGVWQEKKLYGRTGMGVARTTFVIGPDGTIERVFEKAKPDTNAAEVLSWLTEREGASGGGESGT